MLTTETDQRLQAVSLRMKRIYSRIYSRIGLVNLLDDIQCGGMSADQEIKAVEQTGTGTRLDLKRAEEDLRLSRYLHDAVDDLIGDGDAAHGNKDW